MTVRFLVTGGAGFIGSHLVESLVREGHDVTVLDDFSTGERANLAGLADRIRVVEGSVTDAACCRDAVQGATYVLHHAALVSVQESVAHPERAHAVNGGGTLLLLEAARDAGVRRFVNAGTSAYYGDEPTLPKEESMAPHPVSPYAASKGAAEIYCETYARNYGLETVTLRYFNVFGMRQNAESAYAAVIPKFISAALTNQPPTIYGDGGQTRDFIHVDNVVAANVLACRAPGIAGQAFNIGMGVRISLNALWRQIRDMIGCEVAPRYEAARPGDVRDSVCSLERATSRLGFRPHVSFEDGLRQTIEAHRGTLVLNVLNAAGA